MPNDINGITSKVTQENSSEAFNNELNEHLNELEGVINNLEASKIQHEALLGFLQDHLYSDNKPGLIRLTKSIENDERIKKVIRKYEDKIILELKVALEAQDRDKAKKLFRLYIEEIVQNPLLTQRIDPVFFEDNFVKLLKDNALPLELLIKFGI